MAGRSAVLARRALALKAGVLVLGSALVVLGLVLVVLPGPLTLPPVLLGLWLLSTEFPWAQTLFQRAWDKALVTREAALRRPVLAGATTGVGLLLAGATVWASARYDLLGRVLQAVGL